MPAWIYDILLASAELERTAQLQPCLPWLRPHSRRRQALYMMHGPRLLVELGTFCTTRALCGVLWQRCPFPTRWLGVQAAAQGRLVRVPPGFGVPHLGAGQEARASFNITFWQRGMC